MEGLNRSVWTGSQPPFPSAFKLSSALFPLPSAILALLQFIFHTAPKGNSQNKKQDMSLLSDSPVSLNFSPLWPSPQDSKQASLRSSVPCSLLPQGLCPHCPARCVHIFLLH